MRRVFIGLENINPANLMSAKKKQNKITEYRKMLLAWKQAGIITYAGYILGFPGDTAESIAHDIEVIKKELPVDLLEFFYLTPLPGSEDHKQLFTRRHSDGRRPQPYDLYHITTEHPKMTRAEWAHAYDMAWKNYYTLRARRDDPAPRRRDQGQRRQHAVPGDVVQGLHPDRECPPARRRLPAAEVPPRPPLRRCRSSRCGRSIRSTGWRRCRSSTAGSRCTSGCAGSISRIKRDPARHEYTDLALTPVIDDETETRELFNNVGAQAFVSQERRLENFRHGRSASPSPLAPSRQLAPELQAEQAPLAADAAASSAR